MKKILFFAAVAALSAIVSCQKEEAPSQKEAKPIVFSASIAAPSDTKVLVDTDEGKVSWVKDDEITITDGTNTGVYKADNAGETTTFTYVSGTKFTESGKYSATYGTMPAAGVDQAYSSTAGELIYMTAPSASTSATTANFTFTAQCGLLKLNLMDTEETKVKRIYVIDESGNAYKLLCETAKSIEGGKDFYIALPAGKYTKYIIRDSEGYEAVKTALTGKETSIAANQINKVTFVSLTFYAPVYPENNTAGTKVADYWWAPVNCGYDATNAPTGLFYQWGRMYGQSNTGTVSYITTQAESMAAGNTEANKDKFYTVHTYECWYYGATTSDTWSSEYDPCPAGWRVPNATELSAIVSSTKEWTSTGGPSSDQTGYKFGTSPNQVFFPIAGYRYYSDGSVYDENGYYWSSSPSTSEAKRARSLRFDSYGAGIANDIDSRGSGFSVRCVQE